MDLGVGGNCMLKAWGLGFAGSAVQAQILRVLHVLMPRCKASSGGAQLSIWFCPEILLKRTAIKPSTLNRKPPGGGGGGEHGSPMTSWKVMASTYGIPELL